MKPQVPKVFESISDLHRTLGLPEPQHPLISLANYEEVTADTTELSKGLAMNMYKISFKFNFRGRFRYGQQYYDFDAGGMSFFSPMQVIAAADDEADYSGYSLHIHPDFLRNYPLGQNIRNYGFFSYAVYEALCLSEQEKAIITGIFESIKSELSHSIDLFSQDIIVSQIEQLLNYSNRFYSRQFITRKAVHHDLLGRLEMILDLHVHDENAVAEGMPSVQELAAQLKISPRYLSDMLRSLTGQNTQQYIQSKMIERAKELLTTSALSIAEIAYQLGFEHPQSFNKIFKKKVNVSPLDFRQSFN